jgi:hypothetical protein
MFKMLLPLPLLLLALLLAPMVFGQSRNNGQRLQQQQALPPPLHVYGRVLYEDGVPVPNAQVQFWHTDVNGSYNHPSSSANNGMALLSDFQYFGTAVTAPSDGSFTFVTYRPGLYGRRPTHIHFKVWINGTEVLTSQLYFADENTGFSSMLELDLWSLADGSLATNQTIVVPSSSSLSSSDTTVLPLTPSQPQGPFYPVINFFNYDNDLTQTSTTDGSDVDTVGSTNANDKTPAGVDDATSPSSSSTKISLHGLFMVSLFCADYLSR